MVMFCLIHWAVPGYSEEDILSLTSVVCLSDSVSTPPTPYIYLFLFGPPVNVNSVIYTVGSSGKLKGPCIQFVNGKHKFE